MKGEKYSLHTQRYPKAHTCACSACANVTSDWSGVRAEQAHFYCLDASLQQITLVKAHQILLTVQGKGMAPEEDGALRGNSLMEIHKKNMAQTLL